MSTKNVRDLSDAEFDAGWSQLGHTPAGSDETESQASQTEIQDLTDEQFATKWRALGNEPHGNGIIRGRFFENRSRLAEVNAEDAARDEQARTIANELIRAADALEQRKSEERSRFDAAGRRGA